MAEIILTGDALEQLRSRRPLPRPWCGQTITTMVEFEKAVAVYDA